MARGADAVLAGNTGEGDEDMEAGVAEEVILELPILVTLLLTMQTLPPQLTRAMPR